MKESTGGGQVQPVKSETIVMARIGFGCQWRVMGRPFPTREGLFKVTSLLVGRLLNQINGADQEKVRETVGSYLESLYNEWFDSKIRDEVRGMRERDQDEMEILENTQLNLRHLKGE